MGRPPVDDKPSGRLISKKAPTTAESPSPPPEVSGPSGIDWRNQETLARFPTTPRQSEKTVTIPRQLGPYEIKGEIARGGMGIVLEAFHTRLQRDVAIKLLRPEAAEENDALQRFMREARATAKLKHPGIVAIHDVVHDEEDRTYLVMDFIRGQSLKEIVSKGPMSPQRAAEVLRDVTRAVAHAHEHGILHRDLKPDNVLIDDRTQAVHLTDFGLAKGLQRDVAETTRAHIRAADAAPLDDAALTQVGEVIGTPLYMAPEQIETEIAPTGAGVDVYALGAVLFECLTGRPPFQDNSIYKIFEKVLRAEPPSPRSLNPLIPAALEGIVLRCLRKHPQDRYASAQALAKELDRFLTAGTAPPPIRARPTHDGGARPGALLLCGALLLGGAAWFGSGPGRDQVTAADASSSDAAVVESERGPAAPTPLPTRTLASPRPDGATPKSAWKLLGRACSLTSAPRRAQEGYVDVQLQFGLAILRGEFPAVPAKEGIAWLERAAQTGYPDAVTQLAAVYQQGIGVPKNPEQEIRWLRFGAQRKIPRFASHLGLALVNRHDPVDRQKALPWLEEALREDPANTVAALALASLVQPRDLPRAVALWKTAAEAGNANAMLQLSGTFQRGGPGVKRDLVASLAWLTRAARKADRQAEYLMGRAYELGLLGLRADADAARRWYGKSAAQGYPRAGEALRRLGG